MPTVFETPAELETAVGQHARRERLARGRRRSASNLFADATDDHQWIHVDPERAKQGPVRRADRARLPDALAREPLPARDRRGATASRWASTTASTGCASRRPCASARASAAAASWSRRSARRTARCRRRSASPSRSRAATKPACVVETISRYYPALKLWQVVSFAEPEQLLGIARAAEEAGLHGVLLSDHLFFPGRLTSRYPYSADGKPAFDGTTPFPEPWTTIAAMAAVTERLRFATMVYILPLRHPARGGEDGGHRGAALGRARGPRLSAPAGSARSSTRSACRSRRAARAWTR